MTNDDKKAAIRARMARTGEKYTTAMRAIEQERADSQDGEEGGTGPQTGVPSR